MYSAIFELILILIGLAQNPSHTTGMAASFSKCYTNSPSRIRSNQQYEYKESFYHPRINASKYRAEFACTRLYNPGF
jgi:hypothetical protein